MAVRIKKCVECGKEFEISGHYGYRKLCCSEECSKDRHRKIMREMYRKAAKEKAKSSVVFLRCEACGDVFPYWKRGRRPKYCQSCRANGGKPKKRIEHVRKPKKREPAPKVKKICPVCGKSFEANSKRKYCGDECARIAKIRKAIESRQLANARPKKAKEAKKAKKKNDRCVCSRVDSCIYGRKLTTSGIKFCDYITITGHARGGYPDECKHYRVEK